MSFTISHTIAVWPLHRIHSGFWVLSALVIGSWSPDFALYFPVGLDRLESHRFHATLWFCIPMGLVVYALYGFVLKRAIAYLLPDVMVLRYGTRAPSAPLPKVALSLWVGSVSHIVWDGCAHRTGPIVRAFPFLSTPIWASYHFDLYLYRLIQHGGTAVGLVLTAWWILRWLKSTPATQDTPDASRSMERLGARVFIVALFFTAVVATWLEVSQGTGLSIVGRLVAALVTGMSTTFGALVLIGVILRLRDDVGRDRSDASKER